MRRVQIRTISGLAPLLLCACATLRAQQLIGYVPTHDADVTGATDVVDGQAVLAGSVGVTAKDHTAPITLGRGGTVRVCQTSVLHLTESRQVAVAAPLLLSLDRGAVEIQMNGAPSDAVMTPDLRFTVRNSGPLDLRLRIARNGDTCVENRGAAAPTLAVSDPFGESMYELPAGQHVLFEHGSVHEVVDHETTPCGCPDEKGVSIADALLAAPAQTSTGPKTATPPVAHPFPIAESEGLAPANDVPQAEPGAVHAQITDTLSYTAPVNEGVPMQTASAAVPAVPTPTAAKGKKAKTADAQEQPHGLAHAVGRFFKKLFGG